ncbi:hypothetical protein ACFE04_001480 [Oxalis oulophora]
MCAKREILLSKVKPLSSGIEQMQTLKKNFARLPAKREPSYSDSVALLKSHLKQRAVCRLIRQDLQLWEVNDLENNNNRHHVVLNYLGLISQRFTINVGLVSSIIISNKMNDINITKNFPNMDAFTAFSFVLRAERTKTYSGFKSLTQETQGLELLPWTIAKRKMNYRVIIGKISIEKFEWGKDGNSFVMFLENKYVVVIVRQTLFTASQTLVANVSSLAKRGNDGGGVCWWSGNYGGGGGRTDDVIGNVGLLLWRRTIVMVERETGREY